MKPLLMTCAIAALVLTLSPAAVALAQEAPAEPPATMACGDCHDLAKTFAANPHAKGMADKGVVPNDVCEICHGPGQAHIESGGEKDKIAKPAGRKGADETCLTCHDAGTNRVSRHGGMHANSETVNCLSCHAIHGTSREPHLLAKPQLALCSTCHSSQVASFRNKPFAHRVGRGGMNCASCHEPHGRPSRVLAVFSRPAEAGHHTETCTSCHSDKRGPFMFQHGSAALGECTTCHEQHGASNAKRLKRATVWQLCIECHSPVETTAAAIGSQPPSFHNLSNPRFRDCTNCHVAIHGSNRSPQLLK